MDRHAQGEAPAPCSVAPMLSTDAETLFSHLRGVKKLAMEACNLMYDEHGALESFAITDASLVHLQGIGELYLGECDLCEVTAAGLAHLVGIKRLRLSQQDRFKPVLASVQAALVQLRFEKVVQWYS